MEIIIIGSFKLPESGSYGGVYYASTTLRDYLKSPDLKIIELDTTLKNIEETGVIKRLPSLIVRNFEFLWKIMFAHKAKTLVVFMSRGNSYVDKFPAIYLAKILNKKIIILPRSGLLLKDQKKKFFNFFITQIIIKADLIFGQSLFWKEYFSMLKGSEEKVQLLENWVKPEIIEKSKQLISPAYDINNSQVFQMVFLSRIEEDKGLIDIIGLAKSLKGKLRFKIDIYGSGGYLDEFKSLIQENKLEDQIILKGWLNNKKIETLNTYHLGIFTSRFEGYPNVLLDYIFARIPYLATNKGSIEAVGGDLAYYYTPKTTDEFAEKVIFISENYKRVLKKSEKLYLEKRKNNTVEKAVKILKENLD